MSIQKRKKIKERKIKRLNKEDVKKASDIKVIKEEVQKDKAPYDYRRIFGNKGFLFIIFLLIILSSSIILNYLINVLESILLTIGRYIEPILKNPFSDEDRTSSSNINQQINPLIELKDLSNLYTLNHYLLVYFLIISLLSVFVLFKLYKVYKRYERKAYDQHGDARFTTLEELDNQYKKIPHVLEKYDGESGFPISHYKDSYYICTDAFNTLIIGTSRSGKGVTSVVPSMDIDSRAEKQPSIIVADPKGELFKASYITLKERGYDVQTLNIEDPSNGMSYNPLALITKYFKRGDLDQAQKYTKNLCHTLFYDPNAGEGKQWNDYASSTTQALILAIVDYCIKSDQEEKITMRNVYNMLLIYAGETYFDEEKGVERSRLDDYFDKLKKRDPQHPAVIAYGTVGFSSEKTRSSIFTTVSGKLEDINKDAIAKMMSRNTIDFKRPGFNKYLSIKMSEKFYYRIGSLEIKGKHYNFKVDGLGYIDLSFKETLEDNDQIYLHFDKMNKPITIHTERKVKFSNFNIPLRDEYTDEILYEDKLKTSLNDEDTDYIEEIEIIYTDKPIAIFMIVPDYDSSEHYIASIFISQMYTELARQAVNTPENKCYRRVKMRIDEFGNFPAINDMNNIITVNSGRNILFELYIQSDEQISSNYGEDVAKTISDNCQNIVYIKSISPDTSERISSLAGNKTVESVSQSAGRFETEMNESISLEQKPLISPESLREFTMGQTLVLRLLKTKDLKGRDVRPFPILNVGKTQMPRSFELLYLWFNTEADSNAFKIKSRHRNLSLIENGIDFEHMSKTQGGYTIHSYVTQEKMGDKLFRQLKNYVLNELSLVGQGHEFSKLANQKDQESFYKYLKELCEKREANYEAVSITVNEILASTNPPIEKRIVNIDQIDKELLDKPFYDEEQLSEKDQKIYEEAFRILIEHHNALDKDIQFLKDEATIETAYERFKSFRNTKLFKAILDIHLNPKTDEKG